MSFRALFLNLSLCAFVDYVNVQTQDIKVKVRKCFCSFQSKYDIYKTVVTPQYFLFYLMEILKLRNFSF